MKKLPSITLFNRRQVIALAMALMMSTASGLSRASIALTSYSEDASSFTATYAFTPDISPGYVSPPGSLWQASLSQSYTPTGFGMGNFDFDWSGLHPLTGLLAADNCEFPSSMLTGTVCNQTLTVADGINSDTYNFIVELVSGGGTATFTGMHQVAAVPVPGAAWLFATGLAGLLGVSRRKTRPIRTC